MHSLVEVAGEDGIGELFSGIPVLSNFIASLVGLIPNCAASVVLAELYVRGIISAGSMMSGLLVGAGTGLLVLIRVNHNKRDNLKFILVLFAVGFLGGLIFDLIGIGGMLS